MATNVTALPPTGATQVLSSFVSLLHVPILGFISSPDEAGQRLIQKADNKPLPRVAGEPYVDKLLIWFKACLAVDSVAATRTSQDPYPISGFSFKSRMLLMVS